MRKFYFAYHEFNGKIWPFTWEEDEGLCVGGRPNEIKDTRVEISESDRDLDLCILEKMYPFKLILPKTPLAE